MKEREEKNTISQVGEVVISTGSYPVGRQFESVTRIQNFQHKKVIQYELFD